ncbi:rhodanese-like domain-containing protein [Paenibacillus sp. HN-1]|uniref:rhodanese-like domain-containing protein n=1 Tax=Paenibacillus TaxID=44249 RepID=UPI001CA88413|nr:rhodanese-like domain-containing protein [Paenibacillus sp. CGMCC 1.18879]MBY9078131.1 rhodanese-like domain-containing protein [Paenibacillus sp. CGMCC 1.18879]MBY9083872.1 rhodanese-like domain-containing protein [Paenibacillus sinensis]
MTFIYFVVGILLLWALVQLWPVPSLTYVDGEEWDPSFVRWSQVKLLDVRDSSEYWEDHLSDSINISVGRLPVVWGKDLSPDDEVVIVSRNWLQQRKAARILARRGFRRLYAVRGYFLPMRRREESCKCNCCC